MTKKILLKAQSISEMKLGLVQNVILMKKAFLFGMLRSSYGREEKFDREKKVISERYILLRDLLLTQRQEGK
ncbi:hypothetical protein [Peribacillus simplex]|uniref:hypothetical protein n=1 Tax=Peribacillus simplex TaxID=1478 RepID=UPI003D2D2777